MDSPGADPAQVQMSLRFLRRVNHMLGYTRRTLHHLERFSRRWDRTDTIRILDVATGSADVPVAILNWAGHRGFNVEVTGIDLHATIAAEALALHHDARLRIVRGNALALPFEADTFDYATTSLFLHHLDDEDVVCALREMARVSRRGMIVGDLLRCCQAYRWIKLFTLWANPIVKNDGPASVAQAFTREEILALRDRAGTGFTDYFEYFGHRFVLAGEKLRSDDTRLVAMKARGS